HGPTGPGHADWQRPAQLLSRIPLRSKARPWSAAIESSTSNHSVRSQHGWHIRRVLVPLVPEAVGAVVAADLGLVRGVRHQFLGVRGRGGDVLITVSDRSLVLADLGDGVDGDERRGLSEAENPAVFDQQEANLALLIVDE